MKFKYAIYYACIATVLFFGILACIYSVENHYKGKLVKKVDAIIPDNLYFTRYSIEDIDSILNNRKSIIDRIIVKKTEEWDLHGKAPEFNYRYDLNIRSEEDAAWIIFKLEKKEGNIYISELVPTAVYSRDEIDADDIKEVLDSTYNITNSNLAGTEATLSLMLNMADSCIQSIEHQSYFSFIEDKWDIKYGVNNGCMDYQCTDYKDFRVLYQEYAVRLLYLDYDPDYGGLRETISLSIAILLLLILDIWLHLCLYSWIKRRFFDRKKTLHYKLLKITNPINFSNPYDEEKVKTAIKLQNKIKSTKEDDIEHLTEIRREIEEKLGVLAVLASDLSNLKKICNPQRYIESNSIEKIELASKLLAILNSNNFTFEEYEYVRLEAEKLKS